MAFPTRASYRADIDGLRAIAVLSVMGFHYREFVRGGFTGVDVFFVISGFLITQYLATEMAAGTFSLLNFYDRRIRRILPALLAMLATVLLAGRFLLAPGDYALLADSAAASAFGVSNFFFYSHTGYFDQFSDLMPLLHTWSLAVEEQFYLVWPLLLLAVVTVTKWNSVAVALGALLVIGCAGSIVYFQYDQKAAFYMALPRAWELGLGALLVFLPALSRGFGEVAALVGLILIGIGFTLAPGKFPGQFALYPCMGAALIIWPRAQNTISARLLGLLAPVGLISYSLYLWHWPVLVYFRIYINDGMPTVREFIALAVVSFVPAFLCYRFVERPFRKRRWSAPRVVSAGLAAATAIFCASMYVDSAEGLPQRLSPDAQPMRSGAVMWDWPCNDVAIEGISGKYCVFGAPWRTAKRKTIIWGDSHAQHLAPIVNAINEDPDRSFLVYAGCTAALGREIYLSVLPSPGYTERCRTMYSEAVKLLKADSSISQVIFTSNWLELPWRARGDSLEGIAALSSGLTALIEETATPDRHFLLIGTVPHIPLGLVDCATLRDSTLWRSPCAATPQPSEALAIKQASVPTEQMLIDIAKNFRNVTVIVPTEKMCAGETCDLYQDGEFLYRDSGHIRRNLRRQTMRDFSERIGLTAALADGVRRRESTDTGADAQIAR
jgi:peptidoglycan/LPS O-acetylase OafA/YrhL